MKSTFLFGNSTQSPCKGCERLGCGAYHSQCEKYQQYKNDIEVNRIQKIKEHELESAMTDIAKAKEKRLRKYKKQ